MRPLFACLLLWILSQPAPAAAAVEFNRDVRPILSDKCFGCHGPDAKTKNIPLRLDVESMAKSNLGGRFAIVEGDPARSEVIRRVTSEKKALRMPPIASGHTLSEAEIEILRAWIAQGAKWQKHWSFLPPVRHPLPRVRDTKWARNPVDHFILARLEQEGLKPSPEASKETLARRVSLDLTGLPPTIAELDAFLNDSSPRAYEALVDRLLASPRYGERMAIRWLDAARYADTNGYQFDGERVMWRWRDYVIESFNRNKPYDRFLIEQIAGDLLPDASLEQKIATGFNRNHRANTEDGIIPEEYAVEYVVDRIETASTVFLGLTMGCARCHNHKYDPITQKDFYQLYGYFGNVPEYGRAIKYGNSPPLIPAPTAAQQEELRKLEARMREVESAINRQHVEIQRAQVRWEKGLAQARPLVWVPREMREAAYDFDGSLPGHSGKPQIAPGKLGNAVRFDGNTWFEIPSVAQFDIDDRFSIAGWVRADCDQCTIWSRMTDSAKGKGFGLHIDQGKLFLAMTNVWADDATRMVALDPFPKNRWTHLAATYTGSKMAEGWKLYVDGKPIETKVLQDTLYRPFRNAGSKFTAPFRIGAGNGPNERYRGLIDEVQVYRRVLEPAEVESLAAGETLNHLAAKPAGSRTAAEQRQLDWYFLDQVAPEPVRGNWHKFVALRQEKEELERTFPSVMIMAESNPRKQAHILIRGQYDKPGEAVDPGVPEVLPPLPAGAPNNRLGLALWMTGQSHPLTARVAVNRMWQYVFGTGLVKTTEDFGVQGEWPSHPELLDWLATEFVRSGWDVKAMMKLLVTSAAYRQRSASSPELTGRDPENRLLARGPRTRLPAEMVRDSALLSAGLLSGKLGGPSVKPYQPDGLWQELIMQDMYYVQSKGEDLYRRSLYTFWKRTVAPPMMANFDSALRESCTVRENRTNTPLQALNLMNDVTFIEAARFVGQRMMREAGPDPNARLAYGFRLITSRNPTEAEKAVLRGNLQYHLDYFAGKPERVKAYLSQGDSPPDPKLDARELAAYASVASLMFNLDEAITKE
jgi:mono/diheme cytochrome c family protein